MADNPLAGTAQCCRDRTTCTTGPHDDDVGTLGFRCVDDFLVGLSASDNEVNPSSVNLFQSTGSPELVESLLCLASTRSIASMVSTYFFYRSRRREPALRRGARRCLRRT